MRWITLSILFLLLTGIVLAADTGGPMPYPIFGIITIEGDKINAMDVSVENLDTGARVVKQVMQGELVMDGSEIGRASKVKVTYCISDSRCDEFSNTFNIDGVSLNIGIDITSKPGGLSGPYSVYGHVYKDGTLLTDVEITLENLDKGYSKDIDVNKAGEYVYSLANWGVYDTGDAIRVSHGPYSAIGYVKGAGLNLDLRYTTTSPDGGGNGGSNNGGGGTTVPDDIVEPVDPIDPIIPIEPDTPQDVPDDVIDVPGEDINGWIILGVVLGIMLIFGLIWYFKSRR